jgi:hypothetical protein
MTDEQIENQTEEDPIENLRGLEWQVNIRHRDLYYVGRGGTPNKALADLVGSIVKGIDQAEEQLETFRRRLAALQEALADVQEDNDGAT